MYRLLRTLGVQPSMLYRRLGLQPIRMAFIPTAEVTALIERSGGSVLAVDETPVNGSSAVYYATKRDAPSGSGSATHQYARPVSLDASGVVPSVCRAAFRAKRRALFGADPSSSPGC